jgi:hypothetical protein
MPAPKPRPGLVRRVMANPDFTHAAVEVAYGTSQIREKVYAWDLVITLDTRFDLKTTKTLPWCSDFFSKRLPRRDGPIIGKLHEHSLKRLHKMIEDNGI